jgi:hypothetical protein
VVVAEAGWGLGIIPIVLHLTVSALDDQLARQSGAVDLPSGDYCEHHHQPQHVADRETEYGVTFRVSG